MTKTKPRANRPIGVFDSGLGGLTVVKALMRDLPNEDVVYFGDTARVPYGTKSRESIIRFSKDNARVLLGHDVKMIVVACNSSSSHALEALRRSVKVPVIGVIDPGARKAVEVTRNGVVGVIATPATINSASYTRALRRYRKNVKVVGQPCPLFVPLIEEGWFDREVTRSVAAEYLAPVKRAKADALILGCTHYPLLKPLLQKVVGSRVTLIDSAREVAGEVKDLLDERGEARARPRKARYQFLVSDEPSHFQALARRFLGRQIPNVKRVKFS